MQQFGCCVSIRRLLKLSNRFDGLFESLSVYFVFGVRRLYFRRRNHLINADLGKQIASLRRWQPPLVRFR